MSMRTRTPKKAYHSSLRVSRALQELGDDIRKARLRRRLPMAVIAARAAISRATLTKIERGDGGVAFGNYAMVLNALGLLEHLQELAAAEKDLVGLALEEEKLPRRIRLPKYKNSHE